MDPVRAIFDGRSRSVPRRSWRRLLGFLWCHARRVQNAARDCLLDEVAVENVEMMMLG